MIPQKAIDLVLFDIDNKRYHHNNEQMHNFKTSGTNSNNVNLFEELWRVPGVKYMYYRDDNNTPDKGIIHLEKRSEKNGKKEIENM